MSIAELFYSSFVQANTSFNIEIESIEDCEYWIEIKVRNSIKTGSTKKQLLTYFGGLPLEVEQIPGTLNCIIKLSKFLIPSESYGLFSILKNIEKNKKKGWFLGIGDFGPHYFAIENLTHAIVSGASGYGKSNLFRFLLCQTLAFQENIVNFIIDPKQIDFKVFEKHPRVAKICTNLTEWKSLFESLLIELGYREHIFSSSFASPPVNINKYWEAREKYNRNDLPDFPRLMIWIDEAHMIFSDEYHTGFIELIEPLVRKARSFGIHFIYSSQKMSDVPSAAKQQATSLFTFYSQENYNNNSTHSVIQDMDQNKATIPGRLIYFNPSTNSSGICQTPNVSPEDSICISFGFSPNSKYPKQGVSRLKIREDVLKSHTIPIALAKGITFNSLNSFDITTEKFSSMRTNKTPFVFLDYYDLFNLNSEKTETEVKESNLQDEDKLMLEFEELLKSNGKSSKSNSQNSQLSTLMPNKPKTILIVDLKESVLTNNLYNREYLFKQFTIEHHKSKDNLDKFKRDLSNNFGLNEIMKELNSSKYKSEESNILDWTDIAIDPFYQSRIDKFIQEVEEYKSNKDRKPSLLILSGIDGIGKETIIYSLMKRLHVATRLAKKEDLYLISDNETNLPKHLNLQNENGKIEQVNKIEALIFTNVNDAIKYYRHSTEHKIVILVNKHIKKGFIELNNPNEFRYLKEPYYLLSFDENSYSQSDIALKLCSTIAKKHKFQSNVTISNVAEIKGAGVFFIPETIDSIFERAYHRAIFRAQEFNNRILNEVLIDFKLDKAKENNSSVKIIKPSKDLKQLIVSKETLSDIEEIIHRIKNINSRKYRFIENLRKSGRMVSLFTGLPGTGKSLAAEVVAFETGKELWVVSIDTMINYHVGETEKIMTSVFEMATSANAVLLIDEADSFLQSREQNQENYEKRWVNHLLNLIESYSGILIMTTNFAERLDSAFSRRIDFKVLFSEPSQEQIIRILKNLLLPDAPVPVDLDFLKITKDIQLSGGLIRNAVERAVLKMEKNGLNILSEEILREALSETYNENLLLNRFDRKVGI